MPHAPVGAKKEIIIKRMFLSDGKKKIPTFLRSHWIRTLRQINPVHAPISHSAKEEN
jgi:hypothetical protein